MQIISFIVIGFALCGIACTFICVFHGLDFLELLPLYNVRKKKVGANFWGLYGDSAKAAEEIFKLPKLFDEENGAVVGSTKYSAGKPVKSCRS